VGVAVPQEWKSFAIMQNDASCVAETTVADAKDWVKAFRKLYNHTVRTAPSLPLSSQSPFVHLPLVSCRFLLG